MYVSTHSTQSLDYKGIEGLSQVGHQGIVRTLSLLRERFYWPGMHNETLLCRLISAKIV